jgi:hypothetical protein
MNSASRLGAQPERCCTLSLGQPWVGLLGEAMFVYINLTVGQQARQQIVARPQ